MRRIPALRCATRRPRPGFTSCTTGRRFDPKIAGHRAARRRRSGASVSVADFDGDGKPDLYFTNSRFGEPNALYRNKGDGTFEEVAASAGVADLNRPGEGVSMGAVWGDIDNDGREDLLVYRYGYLSLFKNVDGRNFVDITEQAGLRRWVNSNGAIWLDYDRDGLLDLYVTAYFRDVDLWHLTTTRIMHDSFEFANNGGKNLLFHNLGGGKFEDVTDKMGVGSTRWTLAAASADFNGDGWPDIYLANDYGPEELYLNDHGQRFKLTTAGLESESKSGMAVALGDAFNRGRLDAFVTNISERGYLFQNNNLRLNEMAESRRFRNVAEGADRRRGMGVGRAVRRLQQRRRQRAVRRQRLHLGGSPTRATGTRCPRSPAPTAALFEDAATWPAFGNASLSGYERSRVYLNRGVAGWVDVAQKVGANGPLRRPRRRPRRSLQPRRGRRDRREPEPAGRALSRSARQRTTTGSRSSSSARAAIAARSAPRWSSRPRDLRQRRVVDGGSGFASQNDRRLHFGLGTREWVDRLVINWPSGEQQIVTRPPIDRIRHDHRAASGDAMTEATPVAAAASRRSSRDPGSAPVRSTRAISSRFSSRWCCSSRSSATTWSAATSGSRSRSSSAPRPRPCSPGSTAARSSTCQSAYISGISLTLLTKPQGAALWPFVIGGFLAISSKYVVRYRDNHLWNPTNFAISALLLLAPDRVSVLSHQFGNDLTTNLVIWTFGLIIAARVGVVHITLTLRRELPPSDDRARRGARPAAAPGDRADHRPDVSALPLLHDHRSAHDRARQEEADRRHGDHRGRRNADPPHVRQGVPLPTAFNAAPRSSRWRSSDRSRSTSTCATATGPRRRRAPASVGTPA